MDCFAGLDVSTRKTAICVISNDGEVLLEIETPTEPAAISTALKPFRPPADGHRYRRARDNRQAPASRSLCSQA